MTDLLEVLNAIAELLYQEKQKDAYGLLIQCLPAMGLYIGEIKDAKLQAEVMQSLAEAVSAMEAQDSTLLADILQYEIIEKLAELDEE